MNYRYDLGDRLPPIISESLALASNFHYVVAISEDLAAHFTQTAIVLVWGVFVVVTEAVPATIRAVTKASVDSEGLGLHLREARLAEVEWVALTCIDPGHGVSSID
jgi:hypothetical protein